jgi:hypothetical protein
MAWIFGIAAVIAALAISSVGAPAAAASGPPAVGASATIASATSGTVWLCRPGQSNDPCASSLQSTSVPAHGARTIHAAADATNSKFDCFYVYPTVSTQLTANSNLTVQSSETDAAIAQAARFSQVCRVWAPMYRQRTEVSLLQGLGAGQQANAVAYASLRSAFRDYLADDNDGRPIVFIGHSQGAAMLIRLLESQVDSVPSLRARTVVAILAGGNVTVPEGKTVGATFKHLPLCTKTTQSGCVIAYSSFPSQPPADADFGRPGMGVSLQSGQTATSGMQVACVNPAAIGGGKADLYPDFLTVTSPPPAPRVTTPWVSYPELYSAACQQANGATWLQVSTLTAAGRPVVSEKLGPAWGYHLDDINLALGNLVNDVRSEEAAYTSSAR